MLDSTLASASLWTFPSLPLGKFTDMTDLTTHLPGRMPVECSIGMRSESMTLFAVGRSSFCSTQINPSPAYLMIQGGIIFRKIKAAPKSLNKATRSLKLVPKGISSIFFSPGNATQNGSFRCSCRTWEQAKIPLPPKDLALLHLDYRFVFRHYVIHEKE